MAKRGSGVLGRPAHRLWAVSLLAALLLGGALALLPAAASAVTPVATEPQARQKLSDAPGAVTLAFTRQVDPSVAKVIVSGPDGANVTTGPLVVEGTNVTSHLRDGLGHGTYTVHFRIDSSSGDVEGGAFQFSYGSGSFSDLPDKSWSGEDHEPAVLRGTNPNGPESPAPGSSKASETPGIQVTSQAASSDPKPPPTDPASTVQAPPGPATEAGNAPQTSLSPTPTSAGGSGGGSGTPWVVGGLLLLIAVGGTAFGLWHSNQEKKKAGHD